MVGKSSPQKNLTSEIYSDTSSSNYVGPSILCISNKPVEWSIYAHRLTSRFYLTEAIRLPRQAWPITRNLRAVYYTDVRGREFLSQPGRLSAVSNRRACLSEELGNMAFESLSSGPKKPITHSYSVVRLAGSVCVFGDARVAGNVTLKLDPDDVDSQSVTVCPGAPRLCHSNVHR